VIWQLVALLGAISATSKGDRVEVREGSDVLTSFVPSTPAARRGAPVVRETTVSGRALIEVRLPLAGSPARQELWIGERGPRGTTALWTGMLGATDADGETRREVVAGADGLELFQTATRLGRCDGAPVRLFRERWDFGQRRFRPAPPALPPASAQALQARRGDPDMPVGRPVSGFFWTGASSTAGAKDARTLGAPWALNDGDPGTVWAAGGDGRGEWVTARSSTQGAAVVGLRITPGPEAWRPRRLTLLLGPADDQRFDVELADAPAKRGSSPGESWWVRLPRPVPSSCMTVLIREGGPGGAPAIGDLDVITDLDGPDGIARLVEQVRSGTDCESRVALLAAVGEAAAKPVAAAIQQGPGPGRECLLSVLDRMKALDPSVAPAVVAALERASPAEERLVLGLLPRLSPPPVAALAGMLDDEKRPDDDRARAARGLAALDRPEAWTALVASAGAGSPGLRVGVRELLAGAKAPLAAEVRGALESQPPLPRRADLVFVLGTAAAREPDQRAPSLEVLRAAAASSDFEIVARAVAALGRLGDEAAVAALSELRGRSPDAVVRYLATRELASAAPPPALGAVREALDDGDPRVRETAALALGHRKDSASSGRLVAAAKQEPWPFVRRAEVTALGALCTAGDLLVRADERDVTEVRREALTGLTRCRDPRASALLLRALGRREEDPDIRALAARLLATLRDQGLGRPMAEALARMRIEAQEDLALEGVTVVVMQSLSRLGGPEALGAALQLLRDERAIFKRTALEALGQLCDPAAAAAVATAMRDPDPSVAAAAGAAQRRCKTVLARPAP
jgi:HEAT repeat protein